MTEKEYEKLLNIDTLGEELWSEKIRHYHPYQATSYECLDELFKIYSLNEEDFIVDFGCGKGRLNFYINYRFNSNVVGIEMEETYYNKCIKNKESYISKYKRGKEKIDFKCCYAQDYEINSKDNKFYFFNPFSVQIFRKIVENILESVYKNERYVELILYYPSDDYIYYLENETPFILKEEIQLDKLYKKDINERFLVYNIPYYV